MADSVDNIVISQASVRQKADEVAELERRTAKARGELSLLVGYLRFIGREDWVPENLVIFSATDHAQLGHRVRPPKHDAGTWTGEIVNILRNSPNGISLIGIRDELAKGELAERLRKNANGFYNAVTRLEATKDAVKYKGRVFSTENYEAFKGRVARGEVEDLSGEERPRTIGATVIDYISQFPSGVPAKQIVTEMVASGAAPTEASVYNILSKLGRAGRVRRDNGVYFPVNEMGRSQNTESGPEAGGVAAPPVENQGQRKLDLG